MKIISVVGARPNFMKIAPFIKAINEYNNNYTESEKKEAIEHILVHTGQHYDDRMSKSFFKALKIPEADINLGVGSGSHAYQVGNTMMEFEKVLQCEKPDWVVVVGDVNATLACSVTAKKEHVKLCHIEAGLRSRDMQMPEEINRLVTDRLADLLLTPDQLSIDNLKAEGARSDQIDFVGNIMIDTLLNNYDEARMIDLADVIKNNIIEDTRTNIPDFGKEPFAAITLHRPSNVDHEEILVALTDFIVNEITRDRYVIWPIHPRTKNKMMEFDIWDKLVTNEKVFVLHPLAYHQMLRLSMGADIMLTDSGGLQEECTVLRIPCLTLRWNTERPVTLKENGGACMLVGNSVEKIRKAYHESLKLNKEDVKIPQFWDGKTAERCLEAILNY